MKSYKENISTLIVNQIKGVITAQELTELNSWISAKPANKALFEKLTSELWLEKKATSYSTIDSQSAQMQMKARIAKRAKQIRLRRLSIAASIAIVVVCTSFFLNQESQNIPTTEPQVIQQKSYKALLTLDDGTEVKIGCDETTDSNIHNSEHIVIEKDQINYSAAKTQKVTMNKLSVSRKESYSIILNDGTRVWLNSDTELRYPTLFMGDIREVFLKGEAYFEVAKSTTPFIVKTPNSSIRVLGTAFNVSCYSNEPELTTLTEGRVELKNSTNNQAVILNPGMQGIISTDDSDIEVKHVNTEVYLAWRYGFIHFENETLETIMKQISRWYDIDVQYHDEQLKNLHFYIKITKEDSINEFIRILELTKIVKCKQEGNKIIITNHKKSAYD